MPAAAWVVSVGGGRGDQTGAEEARRHQGAARFDQSVHVVERDGPHPRRILACGWKTVGLFAQIAIVARDIAAKHLLDPGWRLSKRDARLVRCIIISRQQIRADVGGIVAFDADVARAFAGEGHEIFGDQAKIVARLGIADAIAESDIILRLDLRDAILRARELNLCCLGDGGLICDGEQRYRAQKTDEDPHIGHINAP